jgi:hypothetical protein
MKRRIAVSLVILAGLIPFGVILRLVLIPPPIELRWKFKKGEEWRYNVTHTTMASRSGGVYCMTVSQENGDGSTIVICMCESAFSHSSSWDYDSERDKEIPTNPVALAFAVRVGKSMTLRMTPFGIVEEVDGIKTSEIARKPLLEFPMDTLLYPHFFDQAGRLVWYLPLPPEKVHEGSRWSSEMSSAAFTMPGQKRFTRTFNLDQLSNRSAHIVIKDQFEKPWAQEERSVVASFSAGEGVLLSYKEGLIIGEKSSKVSWMESHEVNLLGKRAR